MRKIHRISLGMADKDDQVVTIPAQRELIHAAVDDGYLCLLILAKSEGQTEQRTVVYSSPGKEIPDDWLFVGTFFRPEYGGNTVFIFLK